MVTRADSRPRRSAGTAKQPRKPALHEPRSWKSTDAAAAAKQFFTRPPKTAARELMQELCSDDPYDHRCAAELARLVSRRKPGLLAAYADLLAEVAAQLPLEEWQARGYVLVAVRAMALEAFAFLAAQKPDLRDEAMELLEQQRHSSEPALRARARLMMPVLMTVEARPKR